MLNRSDIEILLESLEAWENKDTASAMMGDMLGIMVPPEGREKYKADMAEEKKKRNAERQQRKDLSVRLRAKLLDMRDAIVMEKTA